MSLSDLCREFGVSRPTGYRWINRYKEVGPEGLLDLSRKPHGCSHATSEATENAILALRNKHPSWGARKLKARLEVLQPRAIWPAASTFGNILSRAGLTNPKQKKRRTTPFSEPFSMVTAPNQLWCMDFKGYFSTGDGSRCDPFTITDAHSRYLIRCQTVLRMDLNQVSAICESAMREYGMPRESGLTMALHSPAAVYSGCPSCRSAGPSWASCMNASSPAGRSKTAVTNVCTGPSRKIRPNHLR